MVWVLKVEPFVLQANTSLVGYEQLMPYLFHSLTTEVSEGRDPASEMTLFINQRQTAVSIRCCQQSLVC